VSLEALGRIIMLVGAGSLLLGGVLVLTSRLGLSHLPGAIVWKGSRATVYIPLGLSILASIILTVLLNLFYRR
jgi:hypothetical protein